MRPLYSFVDPRRSVVGSAPALVTRCPVCGRQVTLAPEGRGIYRVTLHYWRGDICNGVGLPGMVITETDTWR